jgi:Molybdopterin converting factor, small subunit
VTSGVTSRSRLERIFARVVALRVPILLVFALLVPAGVVLAMRIPSEGAISGLVRRDDPDWLATRGPKHAAALANRSIVRVAVNQEYAGLEHPVKTGDEVALFPPVTGG